MGYHTRNTTVYCPHCQCYRNMAIDDRSRCQLCRKRHDDEPNGTEEDWQDYAVYLTEQALREALAERADDEARLAEMEAVRECGPDEYPW
jgi:hypothetical protein